MSDIELRIRELIQQLENAWNASDSAAWTSHFAEDARFIHIFGGQLDGRAAIEGSHRNIFDTIYKGSRLSFTLRGVRVLRPDIAIVWTRGLVRTAQGDEVDTRPTMVVVNDQSRWTIVAFQNTRVSEIPAAAGAAARLAT